MKSLVLGTGLRVIMAPSPTDVVYCGIAVDSGTRDELDTESGIAHFTEHMSFKGTTHLTSRQIITRMEAVGGDLNAFTGKEETVFYCTCEKEHIGRALSLLSDIVTNSTYPQDEMDKEVEVVIDEIESYNDSPSELIYDDFEAILFKGHPLGRNILGNAKRLREYKSADIKTYTRRMFRPERMVLFVYGNVNEDKILKSLTHLLTTQPSVGGDSLGIPSREVFSPKPISNSVAISPSRESENLYVLNKDTHQAHVMMGARAFGGNDKHHLALFLANNILGGPGLSSRLNLSLREKRGLVYTVDSSITTYTDTGLWAVYFGCDKQDVNRCQKLVKRELDRMVQSPLGERTLSAAKRQLCGQIALSYDNFENVAIGMGKRLLHYNRTQTRQELCDSIMALTSEELLSACREVFNPDKLTTLIYK